MAFPRYQYTVAIFRLIPRAALRTCDVIPLQYALVLSQFEAPGFAPAMPGSIEPLISERVTVTSLNAPGVVPRSYEPPGYVHAHEGDYNTAMGYLENGNQRCVSATVSAVSACREAEARPPACAASTVRLCVIRAHLRRPGLKASRLGVGAEEGGGLRRPDIG